MTQSDHIPKISIYKAPTNEKSGLTFKPVLAGVMLIIIDFYLIIRVIFSNFTALFPLCGVVGIIFFIISIIGGVFALKRIKHKFSILGTILTFVAGFGMGFAFLAIIPMFLIILSDDEFTS